MDNKYKLAIIELETHPEILNIWFNLLDNSDIFEVVFYINKKLIPFINFEEKCNIIIYDNEKSNEKNFILNNFNNINNKYDLIIINTLHKRFNSYKNIIESNKTLLIVHNFNFCFNGFLNISIRNIFRNNLNDFIFFLKLIFLEKFYSFFNRNINQITFASLLKNPSLLQIPLFIVENKLNIINNNYINLVIPGEISNKRKDINKLLEILIHLKPKNKLKFTFLGKTSESKIIQNLEKIQQINKNIEIIFFKDRVESTIFNQIINQADILLCPVKNVTYFNNVKEVYSETKISGNEFDCIKNSKIGIFPSYYNFPHWENFYYKDFNQLKIILNDLDKNQINQKYSDLEKIIHNFGKENVLNKIENILLSIIK